ncbi:MAG TPA: hypothetical protein VFB12_12165 [Ktedonobacteraceae bacterium]|nr:hypothetical protein [Ktedonobacteraceae bacterium]
MTTLLIVLGLVGILLIGAVVASITFNLRPTRLPRRRHTTALHSVIFRNEED